MWEYKDSRKADRKKTQKPLRVRHVLMVICALFFVLSAFMALLYRYDNKYSTIRAETAPDGLYLRADMFDGQKVYALADHWEYYGQVYLSPQELEQTDIHPQDIYIGQYPDFAMRDSSGSIYGCATYRLRLHTKEPLSLSLYLPEIYSSYTLWAGEQKVLENGTGGPLIMNRTVHFTISADTDLVIAVKNTSHYYSGMYFVPLLGTGGMERISAGNMIFYAFLCFSTLSIALYVLSLWQKMKKERINLYFFLLAFSFAGYECYPLLVHLGFSRVRLVYGLCDLFYFLVMYALVRINTTLAGKEDSPVFRLMMHPLSLTAVFFSMLSEWILGHAGAETVRFYGLCIDSYKLIVLMYLVYTVYHSFLCRQRGFLLVLSANLIYGFSILMTLVFANRFEPVIYGWPNDYCGFLIIVSFTLYAVQENNRIIRENELLTAHLEDEVRLRTAQLQAVLRDRKRMLAEISHDIKAPLSSLNAFVDFIHKEHVEMDDETQHQLDIIRRKSAEAMSRMGMLKELSVNPDEEMFPVPVCLNTFLQKQYENFKPDTDANAVFLKYEPGREELFILGIEAELSRVFDNLLYNALAFTPSNREIILRLFGDASCAFVEIEDNGIGIASEHLDKIFERGFSLRECEGDNKGFGLYIAYNIVKEHGGKLTVSSVVNQGTVFRIVLPKYHIHS